MTDRKLKRIMKRDRRRRRAQGIGALAGVLTSVFAIGLVYGEEILKNVDKLSEKIEKLTSSLEGSFSELNDNAGERADKRTYEE